MANLFADFLKPFTSGMAKPMPNQTSAFDLSIKAPAPAPQSVPKSNPTPTPAPAAAGASYSPVVLPTGAQAGLAPDGTIGTAPSSFSIDVSKPITSDVFASTVTNTDVQNTYANYVKQLADAYKPTQDYLDALKAVQAVKARDAELDKNLLTGEAPGDTLGFAQGRTAREKGLNSIEGLRAEQALQVQELIRQGNIEGAKALVTGAEPRGLSYGQTLTNPITGETIAVGQTQPSFSATASPFGGYLVFDQRTGQYSVVGADALTGGGAPGGTAGGIPTFIQPAIGEIAGTQFIDVGKISAAQLPYAQQISAQYNIPLLSTEDANKVQEAQATYTGAVTLLDTIANSAENVIYATNTAEAIEQAARLNAKALLPNTQERLYRDTKKAFLSMLTRAAGEKGVLTDLDVARIEKALPDFLDTVSIAQQKRQQLRAIFDAQVQGAVSAYLGVNTTPVSAGGVTDMSAYAF